MGNNHQLCDYTDDKTRSGLSLIICFMQIISIYSTLFQDYLCDGFMPTVTELTAVW